MAAARHSPNSLTTSTGEGRDEILLLARSCNIAVETATLEELSALCASDAHQSFAAELRPNPELSLKELLAALKDRERALLLALDGVQDPHNLGAILRAAECFGVDAVLWSRNRGASITPAVRKVSVGASELVPSLAVGSLAEALERCAEADFWIVAAEARADSKAVHGFQFPKKSVIVLGSEGEGLHALVSARSNERVVIPLFGKIDSLNVSQAAAVLLHEYRAQHQLIDKTALSAMD